MHTPTTLGLTVDGVVREVAAEERLVDALTRLGTAIPHVCYHPQFGPIQTCDTCMIEVDGKLTRACATTVADWMTVITASAAAKAAQTEAFDRILTPEAVARLSVDPIAHLVNTHWHFDSTDGDAWLHSALEEIVAAKPSATFDTKRVIPHRREGLHRTSSTQGSRSVITQRSSS